ncbi:hypothetical protein CXG81DRAFT_12679 [Caulochytrium protostelioides]|uniref:Enoyl reductase (ER) domain-containing protein n=1 Tax=Caulochytrium protostelioides TaxID=1555241 RepID=A0A4P9X6S3_9FUNG|nr:hypothetical protein CXG81DRAFT_12679 [Caulochytrium protostelioides]|eukprot:RKP00885.1 hypothetical protein CXG81DRAFT_12679 [Caulochytrium protostelioides]
MADTSVQFNGWAAKKNWSPEDPLEKWSYNPPKLGPNDVTIAIDYCGICGSDLHTILPGEKGGWSPKPRSEMDPVIVGHEIVGKVVEVGSQVKDHKVGDIVGVGAQARSCMDCEFCTTERKPLCPKTVSTYNAKYHHLPDYKLSSQGGYADKIRVHEHWVLPIPKSLDPKVVGPLMCAGITLYAPLKRHGAGPGKTVGVMGVGGLGHMGIKWAKAMGCERVVAVSHSDKKKDAATKLGATDYCNFSDEKDVAQWSAKLDLLVVTSFSNDTNWDAVMGLTKMDGGVTCVVAAPNEAMKHVYAFSLLTSQRVLTGSLIGDPTLIKEMLEFAAKHNITPDVEIVPMSQANDAVLKQHEGKARFRYVLDAHA